MLKSEVSEKIIILYNQNIINVMSQDELHKKMFEVCIR